MKKYLIIVVLLFTGMIFAQDSKLVLEPFGNKVRATYFYENGEMQQVGYFENGKLQGTWVTFDENGNKISSGQYENGVKTGKWFFWNKTNLTEVDYSNNAIASVKNWKQEAIATTK